MPPLKLGIKPGKMHNKLVEYAAEEGFTGAGALDALTKKLLADYYRNRRWMEVREARIQAEEGARTETETELLDLE